MYNNGILTLPINIHEIARALGSSSLDLGTLCQHRNINMWSKVKPIAINGYGMEPIPDSVRREYNYGLSIPSYSLYNVRFTVLPSIDKNTILWEYQRPTQYFRVYDFHNYNRNAKMPFDYELLDDVLYKGDKLRILYERDLTDVDLTGSEQDEYPALNSYDHIGFILADVDTLGGYIYKYGTFSQSLNEGTLSSELPTMNNGRYIAFLGFFQQTFNINSTQSMSDITVVPIPKPYKIFTFKNQVDLNVYVKNKVINSATNQVSFTFCIESHKPRTVGAIELYYVLNEYYDANAAYYIEDSARNIHINLGTQANPTSTPFYSEVTLQFNPTLLSEINGIQNWTFGGKLVAFVSLDNASHRFNDLIARSDIQEGSDIDVNL